MLILCTSFKIVNDYDLLTIYVIYVKGRQAEIKKEGVTECKKKKEF